MTQEQTKSDLRPVVLTFREYSRSPFQRYHFSGFLARKILRPSYARLYVKSEQFAAKIPSNE